MKKSILILMAITMIVALAVGCAPKKNVEKVEDIVLNEDVLVNDLVVEDETTDKELDVEKNVILEEEIENPDKDKVTDTNKDKVTDTNKDKVTDSNKDKDKDKVVDTNKDKVVDSNKDKVADTNNDKVVVEDKIVSIEDIHNSVKKSLGENYYPNMEMNIELLEGLVGLKSADIETYIAEMPMISAQVDTFIAIKAKDGKIKDIQNSLDTYRKGLINDSMQYPMNIAKVQSSKVVIKGDYAFFLMLGQIDEREDITEEEALEFAKSEIKKLEDVINKFF